MHYRYAIVTVFLFIFGWWIQPTIGQSYDERGEGFYDYPEVARSVDFQPSWSPRGTKIAFTTGRTGNYEIYVLDMWDGHLDNVSRHPENDFYAVWSPDGDYIAYFSERDDEDKMKNSAEALNDIIPERQQPVSSARNAERPSWFPDGDWYVYHKEEDGNYDIYKEHYRKKEAIPLTSAPHAELFPTVNPDGQSIAYIAQIDDTLRLAIMDVDGSNQRVLPLSGAHVLDPAWSPDGSKLLLTLSRDHHTDLIIYEPELGSITTVDDDPTFAMNGVWSPDGSKIAYLSNQSGMNQIMLYDVEKHSTQQLTSDPASKQGLDWSPGGDQLVYVADLGNNLELYILKIRNGYTERLTFNPSN
ncbi:MAG: TolB family protein [Bacteroidota bacterium]